MAEIDGSRTFEVTADGLWAVVADPARLADWVPTMWRARPPGSEVLLHVAIPATASDHPAGAGQRAPSS